MFLISDDEDDDDDDDNVDKKVEVVKFPEGIERVVIIDTWDADIEEVVDWWSFVVEDS